MNSRFSDPRFLHRAYGTSDALTIRIRAQNQFGLAGQNIFEELTRTALSRRVPKRVLDVGAGTGAWHPWIRRYAGPDAYYVAVDQSPAMVSRLRDLLRDDSKAEAYLDNVNTRQSHGEPFDWVGMHYMLYHVDDIGAAIRSAWAQVRCGGMLLTATNGADSYREMSDLHRDAVRLAGLPYTEEARGNRFTLANGAAFFPEMPTSHEYQGGLRFPTLETYLAYYGSGFCWTGIPTDLEVPATRALLLEIMADLVRPLIERTGYIQLSQSTGFFWLQKAENT